MCSAVLGMFRGPDYNTDESQSGAPEEISECVCVWALRKILWLHIDFLSFPSHNLSPTQTQLTFTQTQGKKGMHPFPSKTTLHQHYKWSSTKAIDLFGFTLRFIGHRTVKVNFKSINGIAKAVYLLFLQPPCLSLFVSPILHMFGFDCIPGKLVWS